MGATVFLPRPLPADVADAVSVRLGRAHLAEPFSTIDPRATVRRVAALMEDLSLQVAVYRGGVDLLGSEVDHVWVAVRGSAESGPYVVDAAFPLFIESFVATLRRYVAGDASAEDLMHAAEGAGVDERVLGDFPRPVRYVGRPVWSAR